MDQALFNELWWARDAARSAHGAMVAAWVLGLASLAVTVIGLRFIHRQLKVAEDSAEAARKSAAASEAAVSIALAELRPWIMLDVEQDASAHFKLIPEPAIMVMVSATAKNVGRSPALGMRTHVMPLLTGSDREIRAALEGFASAKLRSSSTLFPDEERKFTSGQWVPLHEVPHAAPSAHALVAVEYRSAASDKVHWTVAYVCEFPGAQILPGRRDVKVYETYRDILEPS